MVWTVCLEVLTVLSVNRWQNVPKSIWAHTFNIACIMETHKGAMNLPCTEAFVEYLHLTIGFPSNPLSLLPYRQEMTYSCGQGFSRYQFTNIALTQSKLSRNTLTNHDNILAPHIPTQYSYTFPWNLVITEPMSSISWRITPQTPHTNCFLTRAHSDSQCIMVPNHLNANSILIQPISPHS